MANSSLSWVSWSNDRFPPCYSWPDPPSHSLDIGQIQPSSPPSYTRFDTSASLWICYTPPPSLHCPVLPSLSASRSRFWCWIAMPSCSGRRPYCCYSPRSGEGSSSSLSCRARRVGLDWGSLALRKGWWLGVGSCPVLSFSLCLILKFIIRIYERWAYILLEGMVRLVGGEKIRWRLRFDGMSEMRYDGESFVAFGLLIRLQLKIVCIPQRLRVSNCHYMKIFCLKCHISRF